MRRCSSTFRFSGTGRNLKSRMKARRRSEPKRPVPGEEKKEEKSELPGGLAEIIRDLTRRPPA